MLNGTSGIARSIGEADQDDSAPDGSPHTLIRTFEGRIIAWSPGMQKRYGFSSEEACGRISHQLLRSTFPRPLQAIEATLLQLKAWSGGLIHRHADGRPILTVNHWHMHRNNDDHPAIVTEVHSDMSQKFLEAPGGLVDVLAALAHELGEALAEVESRVEAVDVGLQAGWPDLKTVRETVARAAAQIARGVEGVAVLRDLANGMADTG
jgi:hypothetical protein